MFSKKAALKFKGKRQLWICFIKVAGQEIIKNLKTVLGTTENNSFLHSKYFLLLLRIYRVVDSLVIQGW